MEFSFLIGDQEFEIPQVIDLELFQRAMAWDISDVQNHVPFVATILGCSPSVIQSFNPELFELALGVCVSRIAFEDREPLRELHGHSLKSFNDLTFGDFMDLDLLVTQSATTNAIDIICKLYDISFEEASTIPANEAWPTIDAFIKWRAYTYKEYGEFFETDRMEDDEPIEPIDHSIGQLQLMWYEAVLALANHEFLNIHKVVNRPYREALNFLTWKKNEIAKQKLQNLKRKHDIQRSTR